MIVLPFSSHEKPPMNPSQLEVMVYQIVDDTMLKQNRTDGTGWDWGWADLQRDWMDATPNRFAYRCLPLSIVNQTGWWICNPVGFTATWRGISLPGSIDFHFDAAPDLWSGWINNQFGAGDHHLEHTVPVPHPTRGLPPPCLRARQSVQDFRPTADGTHRERLDEHVVHHELEDHGT